MAGRIVIAAYGPKLGKESEPASLMASSPKPKTRHPRLLGVTDRSNFSVAGSADTCR